MTESSSAPGPIEPTRTGSLPSGDISLYTETFLPAGPPKGVALITHGFMEHCGRYRELAHVIVNAGWVAMTYDVRGHGKSGGTKGFVDRFERYIDDFGVVLAAAKQLAPGKPTMLVGHSHGGLITLRALSGDHPPDVTHAIISSPYLGLNMKVPAWQRVLAKVASRAAPTLKQPAPLALHELTSDPQKQAERKADAACFEFVTMRWFTEAMSAQAYVLEHADRIRVPSTWFVAGGDKIANPAASRRVAERTPKAAYNELAGQMHEVFNEVDRGKVFSQVTELLGRTAASA